MAHEPILPPLTLTHCYPFSCKYEAHKLKLNWIMAHTLKIKNTNVKKKFTILWCPPLWSLHHLEIEKKKKKICLLVYILISSLCVFSKHAGCCFGSQKLITSNYGDKNLLKMGIKFFYVDVPICDLLIFPMNLETLKGLQQSP